MSTPTTEALVNTFEEAVSEIEKLNKRITSSKQLKENNPKEAEHMDSLVEKYIRTKSEIVDKHRHQLKELVDAIHAKEMALNRQRNQSQSMAAELAVEENVGEDRSKIANLKASLANAKDVVNLISQEHGKLANLKKNFLTAVEMHGFDPVSLLPPYEVVGVKTGFQCPKCKGNDTVYVDKNAPNPKSKCLSCGNIWKT
jgi:predicted RNase H-like nuclease (RuvC/YqgF family)